MPNEATLTAAISADAYKTIDDIIAKSAVVKRLNESGYRTSKSNIYKAAILHIFANLNILENDPALLTKASNSTSIELVLKKILGDVE